MTASHDHYIKPVPPTYVTEYEEKFVWPNVDYLNPVGSRFGSFMFKSPAKYDSSGILLKLISTKNYHEKSQLEHLSNLLKK